WLRAIHPRIPGSHLRVFPDAIRRAPDALLRHSRDALIFRRLSDRALVDDPEAVHERLHQQSSSSAAGSADDAPRRAVFLDRVGRRNDGRAPYDAEGRDRKSTRLNSSHVKISYAV